MTIGRPTATRDWLFRAMQALGGWVADDPDEAIYLNVAQDGAGRPLRGENRQVIRFKPDGLPKVKAFWSITMYNPSFNLVANPINRYAVGDRSGLRPDADGGLTIYRAEGKSRSRQGIELAAHAARGPLPDVHARLPAG